MNTDPLAEIVTLLAPTMQFSKLVECAGRWRIHRQNMGDPFYCAILEGKCRMIVDGQPPLILQTGDFVLVPAMNDLVSESLNAPASGITSLPTEISAGRFRTGDGEMEPDLRMQVGHCVFGSPDAALLVSLLPQVVVVRGEPRLATLMQLVADEVRAQRPARNLVLEHLLHVLLIEALRSHTDAVSVAGLVRGLADNRLAAAIRALHARPEHGWTMVELAGQASLSRSAFFARFSRIVGLAPMAYLLMWRMALARQLLRQRELSIDKVAEQVGYSSASTFTVAFTRYAGMPPARYARLTHPN